MSCVAARIFITRTLRAATDTKRRLRELNQHRGVVARRLALAFLAHDLGLGYAFGQRGRTEDEVDAHARFFGNRSWV